MNCSKKILSPEMYPHNHNEQIFKKRAETNPQLARALDARAAIRQQLLMLMRQSGMFFEIIGGVDDNSAMRVNATVLEVAADLITKVGPDRQRTAEYVNGTPRLVIDGHDIAPICNGFTVRVTRNGNHPLIITPTLYPEQISIPNGD